MGFQWGHYSAPFTQRRAAISFLRILRTNWQSQARRFADLFGYASDGDVSNADQPNGTKDSIVAVAGRIYLVPVSLEDHAEIVSNVSLIIDDQYMHL